MKHTNIIIGVTGGGRSNDTYGMPHNFDWMKYGNEAIFPLVDEGICQAVFARCPLGYQMIYTRSNYKGKAYPVPIICYNSFEAAKHTMPGVLKSYEKFVNKLTVLGVPIIHYDGVPREGERVPDIDIQLKHMKDIGVFRAAFDLGALASVGVSDVNFTQKDRIDGPLTMEILYRADRDLGLNPIVEPVLDNEYVTWFDAVANDTFYKNNEVPKGGIRFYKHTGKLTEEGMDELIEVLDKGYKVIVSSSFTRDNFRALFAHSNLPIDEQVASYLGVE